MNVWLRCFILGVVTSLAQAKSYSPPYKANGMCRDDVKEYLFNGHCCSKCSPGTRKASDCTSTRDTVCEPCPDGMFSENMNYYPNCFSCTKCQESNGMVYIKQCSSFSNAECECKPGWFCDLPKETCTTCQKHKTCGPGRGAVSPGTSTKNIRCGICPEGTFSNETSSQPCQPHTRCTLQGRSVLKRGTDKNDAVCGPGLSTVPRETSHPPPITTKAKSPPPEPSVKPPILHSQATSQSAAVISPPPSDVGFIGLWIGLTVAVLLVVLLIAGFCIYHRKGLKPAVQDVIEAGGSNSASPSNPAEKQELLADSSTDPSTSSSSDSHSQGTGVSQDCLHAELPSVSSPVLNVSITATINCQVNPATGSCSIPISPKVHLPEPEFPLSQEEELCVSCEQEDSKDAIQSVQESGMTKY